MSVVSGNFQAFASRTFAPPSFLQCTLLFGCARAIGCIVPNTSIVIAPQLSQPRRCGCYVFLPPLVGVNSIESVIFPGDRSVVCRQIVARKRQKPTSGASRVVEARSEERRRRKSRVSESDERVEGRVKREIPATHRTRPNAQDQGTGARPCQSSGMGLSWSHLELRKNLFFRWDISLILTEIA